MWLNPERTILTFDMKHKDILWPIAWYINAHQSVFVDSGPHYAIAIKTWSWRESSGWSDFCHQQWSAPIQAKLGDICRKMAHTHLERQIAPVNILSRLNIWLSIYGHFGVWYLTRTSYGHNKFLFTIMAMKNAWPWGLGTPNLRFYAPPFKHR